MIGRRELLLGCAIAAVVGCAAMVFFNGAGLTDPTKFHADLTQSPHWAAYHGDAFPEDDLLIEYAIYNESPVQNAIYWLGTWVVDVVLLSKLVGVAVFGLTAALFFLLVSLVSGIRIGILASAFFVIFPRSAYEIGGGFSKAWAVAFVLCAVYVVERRRWRMLLWLMPLAALTYPVSPVMIGAIVVVALAMEYRRAASEALVGLKYLALSSVLGIVPLLYKYLTPPDRIGEMISTTEMKTMWATGESSSATSPLWAEIFGYIDHPFLFISIGVMVVLLFQRQLVWKRSWTALIVASAVCYVVADLVVPRLYLPDRYTRFSIAVLLVLCFAYNWARAFEVLERPWIRRVAVAAVIALALLLSTNTFRPCNGDQSLGCWEDWSRHAELSRTIRELPQPVLVAAHPMTSGSIVIQAQRPVLVIHRMFHPWFREYHRAVDERIRDTYRAIYARDVKDVNRLVDRYGVTHLAVPKKSYMPSVRESGHAYKSQYDDFIAELAADPADFVLFPPPLDDVLFENGNVWLVRLPLGDG